MKEVHYNEFGAPDVLKIGALPDPDCASAPPPIEVLPLDAAVDAHRRSESWRTRGKLVLKVQDLN